MVPSVFAEVDYSQITLDQSSVQVIEFGNYNLVRTHLSLTNNDNEEFSTYNYFLKTNENTYYERSNSHDLDVGSKTCPSAFGIEINAGLTEDFVICFKVPKSSQANFQFEVLDSSRNWCDSYDSSNPYMDPCQQRTFSLTSAITVSYEDLLQTYVLTFENISANVTNLEVWTGPDSNLLRTTLSISNTGNEELSGYDFDIKAQNTAGNLFDPYTSYETKARDCEYSSSIEISPGLTKSYLFCFEVPKNENTFDIIFRDGYGFDNDLESCDNSSAYALCRELFIDVDAGQALAQAVAEQAAAQAAEQAAAQAAEQAAAAEAAAQRLAEAAAADAAANAASQAAAAQEKGTVCSVFDRLCDEEPEHYVERYITEPDYKAWFDRNFPDYTIYEGIGITESQYQKIVNDLTKPQPVAEQKVAVQTSSGGNEIIYVLVAAVAVGGVIGAIFIIKKGSKPSTTVQRESPSRRQTTVLFCGNCGSSLKPEAKFCGKCGSAQS